ncbi:MAG: DUF1080 domain-containing protein [Candidatus Solibacter sp.]|nr:DUF1080 domain-containing protein [Candidatus Solibacter sp.]
MTQKPQIRRRDLCLGSILLAGARAAGGQSVPRQETGFQPLFDGTSLRGWKRQSRSPSKPSLGKWTVENGMIVGGQDPPRVGSYLVTEQTFEDFELQIEANPDWPADTGIMVRTVPQGNVGFQVHLDHRPHGDIGGYYGNGLAGFRANAYALNAEKDKDGRLVRLISEPFGGLQGQVPLEFAAPAAVFLKVWKPGGWNHFRVRSAGALPYLTTWINGEKISELDTAKIKLPGYDPKAVIELIGRAGHIALEVHDNDAQMGNDRWAPGAVCRWRNISIRKLS